MAGHSYQARKKWIPAKNTKNVCFPIIASTNLLSHTQKKKKRDLAPETCNPTDKKKISFDAQLSVPHKGSTKLCVALLKAYRVNHF